jgi:hypothetical protein
MFTNVHLQPPAATADAPDQTARLPRLRFLTNDPAREYAQRPGEVERLPDSVAAMILCKQGFSIVGRNGIKVEGLTRKPLVYWSEHSITIREKAGTGEKVLWTVNRHNPEILHILSLDGEYVESIPLDGKVPWFDHEVTNEVLGAKRRVLSRSMERVNLLHAPDTQKEIERTTHNAEVVSTFSTSARRLRGAPGEDGAEPITTGLVQTFPADNVGGASVPRPSLPVGRDSVEPTNLSPHDRTSRQSSGERINDRGASAASEETIMRENLSIAGSTSGNASGRDIRHSSPASGTRAAAGDREAPDSPSRIGGVTPSARAQFSQRSEPAFPKADRIHQVQRDIEDRRVRHTARQTEIATTRFSADDMEAALQPEPEEVPEHFSAAEISALFSDEA